MSSKTNFALRTLLVASAFTAGVSGIARADDSSIGRFGGDSYAYFNQAPVDSAPSTWRATHRQGVSEDTLEAESSEALAADLHPNAPIATTASDPSFRETHPNGLTERELQALSSEASPWQTRGTAASNALAADDSTQEPRNATRSAFGARFAALFHRDADTDTSVNR